MQKINKRYFFETDVLYHLNTLRAVVVDIPIRAHYGNEVSGLKISRILLPFCYRHFTRFFRRIVTQYFVRDFNFGSICFAAGLPLLLFGLVRGLLTWHHAAATGEPTPTGTVMLVALAVIMGTQLLLTFFSADIASVPRTPIHKLLPRRTVVPLKQFEQSTPKMGDVVKDNS